MSVLGSFLASTRKYCSCFWHKNTDKQLFYENKLLTMENNDDIKVLPFLSFLPLTDIFPQNRHVSDWSVYIIGRDKRLVMSQDNLELSEPSMFNKKIDDVISGRNGQFFDTVFDMIVNGHESQFLMVFRGKLYFANTFTFKNSFRKPIGGILFVRLYSPMSDMMPEGSEIVINVRQSKEYERALQELKKATSLDVDAMRSVLA